MEFKIFLKMSVVVLTFDFNELFTAVIVKKITGSFGGF